VIPCFNAEPTVGETVESIRAQSVKNWELFFVNDGSHDGTLRVLEQYAKQDPRIHVLDLGANVGISGARNLGTERAHGQYLMHTDADDVLPPDALKDHLDALQHADVSYSGYSCFETTIDSPLYSVNTLLAEDALLAVIRIGVGPESFWRPPGALLVRREVDARMRAQFGGWTPYLPVAAELHYYACLSQAGAVFAPTEKIGLFYRKHAQNQSRNQSLFTILYGAFWMVEFWLKRLGAEPRLLQHKADLLETMKTIANVESAFVLKGQ
jgi:glycosyltransferase involved in cell wall biosynthesis